MFGLHPFAALKAAAKYLVTAPEVGNRFIYLFNAIVLGCAEAALILGFIFRSGDKALYPVMFTICLGAHGTAVASRYLNKKADGDAAASLVAAGDAASVLATDKP
jgi:hypothetical protein